MYVDPTYKWADLKIDSEHGMLNLFSPSKNISVFQYLGGKGQEIQQPIRTK